MPPKNKEKKDEAPKKKAGRQVGDLQALLAVEDIEIKRISPPGLGVDYFIKTLTAGQYAEVASKPVSLQASWGVALGLCNEDGSRMIPHSQVLNVAKTLNQKKAGTIEWIWSRIDDLSRPRLPEVEEDPKL